MRWRGHREGLPDTSLSAPHPVEAAACALPRDGQRDRQLQAVSSSSTCGWPRHPPRKALALRLSGVKMQGTDASPGHPQSICVSLGNHHEVLLPPETWRRLPHQLGCVPLTMHPGPSWEGALPKASPQPVPGPRMLRLLPLCRTRMGTVVCFAPGAPALPRASPSPRCPVLLPPAWQTTWPLPGCRRLPYTTLPHVCPAAVDAVQRGQHLLVGTLPCTQLLA